MVMRIKRYEAEEKELPRIIRQVRRDLGENAVVKTKRFRKGGILGLGGKSMVEVYAGVERDLKPEPNGVEPLKKYTNGHLLDQFLPSAHSTLHPQNSNQAYNNYPAHEQPPVIFQPPGQSPIVNDHVQQAPVTTLSSTTYETEVKRLAGEISEIRKTLELHLGVKPGKKAELRYPQWLSYLRDKLLEHEVKENIADKMLEDVLKTTEAEALMDFEATLSAFQRMVTMNIEARGSLKGSQMPRILTLAGPTGVGKTTTLAKLAATASLLDKQRVGLISADTYRIAAIDQLKTFAGIMDIPIKVVFSPAELREAIKEYGSMDRIFIDTAGRSPNDNERMEELRELVDASDQVECHLVISATTRYSDMEKICERFRPSKFSRFIFTKIDETEILGAVLGLMYNEGMPASYLTNGQSVPDDIVLADENDLTSLIIRKTLS